MATLAQWVEGARPRTLPASIAPVMAGWATALLVLQAQALSKRSVLVVALCALVALALQVGVNYANDYSDGIRGTDDQRVGPMRLVGSRAARPATVKAAAFGSLGLAAAAGLMLVLLTQHWWLLAVGVASIAAAWFYTGGKRPYGYAGLGELMVFIFFGLVAVGGTHYLVTAPHSRRLLPSLTDARGGLTWLAVVAAIAIGSLASALLVANNLRDLATDVAAGKHTLATRLGDRGTRRFFATLAAVSVIAVVVLAMGSSWWLLLGLLCLVPLLPAVAAVLTCARGRALIAVLAATGQAELLLGAGLLAGALISLL